MVPLLLSSLLAGSPLDAEIAALQAHATASGLAYELVSSLTTEVGARLAGTEAEARARTWALRRLRALGFDEVWVEPVTVPGWTRGAERATVLPPYEQSLAVTLLGPSVATPDGGIEAEVVRFESLDALSKAPSGSLAGKIAFVDQPMPRTQDGAGYGSVVRVRSGAPREAARRGAVAALIRSVGTDSHRFPHTGMFRYDPAVPAIPAAALAAPDADQLARLLSLGPVRLRLELGAHATGEKPSGNVIAEVRGREHPEQIVLLGAHLDSWDLGTGAVDDGAGVGIVVATAKILLEHGPRRPARTIRVVLFGAEEVGLVGAEAYAKTHAAELGKHVAALESDFGAGPVYRLSARVPDATWPAVAALAPSLARLRIVLGDNGRAGGPDLVPLIRAQVPVIGLDQDGRDYFDLHHTADDTLDKIDPAALAQNVAAWVSAAWWASETGLQSPK